MTTFTREEIVRSLMALGLDRPTAERRADRALAAQKTITAHVDQTAAEVIAVVRAQPPGRVDFVPAFTIDQPPVAIEKDVQREIRRTYTEAGCSVYWLSQARKTGQTAGLPDLWVFDPTTRTAWWHEAKRLVGERSEAQDTFKALCERCGINYVCGGAREAEEALARARHR